jgi:hypothetical protein
VVGKAGNLHELPGLIDYNCRNRFGRQLPEKSTRVQGQDVDPRTVTLYARWAARIGPKAVAPNAIGVAVPVVSKAVAPKTVVAEPVVADAAMASRISVTTNI